MEHIPEQEAPQQQQQKTYAQQRHSTIVVTTNHTSTTASLKTLENDNSATPQTNSQEARYQVDFFHYNFRR